MIRENDRLVIILGMAHSGTSILAYVLSQHPQIVLCASGSEAWLLENHWLPGGRAKPIQRLLEIVNKGKRILLKRPWNELHQADWMRAEMPDARFVYCYRSCSDMLVSWRKPSSMVSHTLRTSSNEFLERFYHSCRHQAAEFGKDVAFYLEHNHQAFVERPQDVMTKMTKWLGIEPWEFDLSKVSSGQHIRTMLWEGYENCTVRLKSEGFESTSSISSRILNKYLGQKEKDSRAE